MVAITNPLSGFLGFFASYLHLPNLMRAMTNMVLHRNLPMELDMTRIINVTGFSPPFPRILIADSYSVGDRCYCHNIIGFEGSDSILPTPLGNMTAQEICQAIGPGPGSIGRPLYNDAQVREGMGLEAAACQPTPTLLLHVLAVR